MLRRRPVPRSLGAVACLLLAAGALTSCGSEQVAVEAPSPTGTSARQCAALLDALPDSVDDQLRRPVSPKGAAAAAWGDPAIVLRCGVPEPKAFKRYSTCQIANGVAWFIPDVQITGEPVEVTMTTVGRSTNVQVTLPADYFPPAAAMVDLAGPIKSTTRDVRPCTG